MVSYTVIRSRRRTMSLELRPDGQVLVRAPLRAFPGQIDAFVQSHEAWVAKHREKLSLRQSQHPEPTPEEKEALRRTAKEILPGRVAYYSGIMGLSPTGLKVTSARTRFGSCSAKDSLCFSLYLMAYPPEAVDYVVVHELAHIRHKNHGPRFYALVASVLPDYRQRRALLKQ